MKRGFTKLEKMILNMEADTISNGVFVISYVTLTAKEAQRFIVDELVTPRYTIARIDRITYTWDFTPKAKMVITMLATTGTRL
jgi:hypothetical protein